ncbi:MAG: heavy-metal-associated domain-containing protein [Fidelibacterota bacterium]|nr:MAG: heavy-metal-associated domain-containing protein [Candidatus Neomarinimicrobiota bacterium]
MMVGLLVTGCSRTEAKTTDISIGTAVCGMCADKIEAAAGAVKGVESVAVDLEKAVAYVKYDANKTSVAAIEDAIVLAGYAANDKPADPAAYEKLPGCCKLDAESKGMHESM